MKSIIQKYLRGHATKAEERKLYDWLHENGDHLNIFKEEIAFYMLEDVEVDTQDVQQAFEEFCQKIAKTPRKVVLMDFVRKYYKYAALVAILVSTVLVFRSVIKAPEEEIVGTEHGSETSFDTENQVTLSHEDGSTQILEQGGQHLSYVDSLAIESNSMNELKVPKGQIFRVLLSDGTLVWLNSSTKLKFPTSFGNELDFRSVWLEGEAYFEVTPNRDKPFIVNTSGVDIQVLGTKFNVSSYTEDAFIQTTLVEGSVHVQSKEESSESILLKPNFQASFNKEEMKLASAEVNVSEYTAWIQRRIVFNNTDFKELIARIERTYNVKIINQNEALENERFTGEFDIENIETVFEALSTSISFKYEITNNLITIKN